MLKLQKKHRYQSNNDANNNKSFNSAPTTNKLISFCPQYPATIEDNGQGRSIVDNCRPQRINTPQCS